MVSTAITTRRREMYISLHLNHMFTQGSLRERDRLEHVLLVLLSSRSPVLIDEELVELLILAIEDALYLRCGCIIHNYLSPSVISVTVPLGDPGSRISQEYSFLE